MTPTTVKRGHAVTIRVPRTLTSRQPRHADLTRLRHAHDFAGLPAVFATVRAGGAFRTTTRIPLGKKPGRYAVTARCGGGNLGVSARLRVVA